jgi:hypothetical protein
MNTHPNAYNGTAIKQTVQQLATDSSSRFKHRWGQEVFFYIKFHTDNENHKASYIVSAGTLSWE